MGLAKLGKTIAIGSLYTFAIAFIFYRSIWAMVLGGVWIPMYLYRQKCKWKMQYEIQMKKQFISGMQMVSASLVAGYSIENAWKRMETDIFRLYGEKSVFCKEVHRMNLKVSMNEPLERVFLEFALKVKVEDIINFAEIIQYAKRSGGNLVQIMKNTVQRMQEKEEIQEEIQNTIASKKMEQMMMNVLLPGILLFLTISSPTYTEMLYHNFWGIVIMSICLIGYIGCVLWSERITDIKV